MAPKGGDGGVAGEKTGAGWERVALVFLALFAATDLLSISVAQMAAAGMGIAWIGEHVTRRRWPYRNPLFWPLAFFVLLSFLAALTSLDIGESIRDSKDLLHITIFFVVADLVRRNREKGRAALRLIATAGAGIALVGLGQAALRGISLDDRISGLQGMYMTYAGLLTLSICVALALLLFTKRSYRSTWLVVAVALMTVAVLLSLTRNALFGMAVGGFVIVGLRNHRVLWGAPLLAAALFFLAPGAVQQRVLSMADPGNVTNHERLLLWGAGIKIVADNPFTGVGQNAFPLVYSRYRSPDVAEPHISHLHNNFLEIAAERGIPCLVAWIAIWGYGLFIMGVAWVRRDNDREEKTLLAAAMGSVVAFLCAGLFEYNFGDSEIQMLFYFLLGVGVGVVGRSPKERATYP